MKVSIITISFNSILTIENTFDSVLKQTHRPLEYIVVDGGSTDGTLKLIEKYSILFQNAGIEFKTKSEPDKGISDAFNKGIERATGEIVGIINSDDALHDNVVSQIVEAYSEAKTDVICGDCLWLDKTKNISKVRKSKMQLHKLRYEMVLMHPTCFVRRSAYEKYGMFDTSFKYCMDKDLMARFYNAGATFQYIPIVISEMSSGGVSDLNYMKVFEEGVIVAKKNGASNLEAQLYRIYKICRIKIIKIIRNIK